MTLRRTATPNAARRRLSIALIVLAWASVPTHAQVSGPLDTALRAIYERNEYAADTVGPIAWLNGGAQLVTLDRNRGLVAYDGATGPERTVVSMADLTPPGNRPLPVSGFSFSAAGDKVLIFTNTRRVWRQNTRGDYWVFDLKRRLLSQIGRTGPEASLMFAKFSPDGTRAAYVRGQDIYVEDLASHAVVQLTTDGGGDIVNGTADWVNEEELFIRDGFRWSPDGRSIAYWQFDTSGVGRFTLINNTDGLYPSLKEFAYPKAGTTNSSVRIGIVPASSGSTVWLKAPGDSREHYIPRMEWIDAATLAFNHTARRQNSNDLMLGDARTGDVRRVYGERSNTWIDSADPLVLDDWRPVFWINGGREFTWISDKDGWRHVYAVTRDGARERLLTRFAGDAMRIVGIDQDAGRLYFIASPDNATQRYLFAADIDSGTVRRVTPHIMPGTHTYEMSPNGRWALHTHSRADVPPRAALISLVDHALVRELVSNEPLAQRLRPLVQHSTEFFQVTVDGDVTLDGMLVKPASFNANRKYPLVVFAYTEPAATSVDDRWAGAAGLFRRALAEAGYLVATFENRGTPAPKGAQWRKSIYGSIGDLSSKEQAAAVRAFGATRPWVDLDRVGIYGHSGGGSATLHALFRFPDVYKVGVASAPGPELRLYDTIYQERYMGLPQENQSGYFKGSSINFAEGLRGRLLLMHGTGDDNVHFQTTERLVNRLVELGKDFDLMVYPNRTHALSEGAGTTLHRWRTVAGYFLEHLPPSP